MAFFRWNSMRSPAKGSTTICLTACRLKKGSSFWTWRVWPLKTIKPSKDSGRKTKKVFLRRSSSSMASIINRRSAGLESKSPCWKPGLPCSIKLKQEIIYTMDCNMPNLDGWQATLQIRNEPEMPHFLDNFTWFKCEMEGSWFESRIGNFWIILINSKIFYETLEKFQEI